MSRYLLDNADARTRARFDALNATYDAASHTALDATGVTTGWRCWEVGAGDGGIGRWLSDRVGEHGSVLITDIDTRWVRACERANTTVLVHDVVDDEPPGDGFDLIHARLVLVHLPRRQAVLDRLLACLRPGGRLVLEEFDLELRLTTSAGDPTSRATFEAVHQPFMRLLESRGADLAWTRSLPEDFTARGLRDVTVRTHTQLWRGGEDHIALHRANIGQVAELLLDQGVSPHELDRFHALLDDPRFAVWSYTLVSTSGRLRPES
ncbi:methyltransferase [Actinosynnema sp. NPDC047251]|uniref:Methyltransferase n=1 Tax=Saccharothrix espanaensis (strain ATCC 51144 / DSM 44229 / JCM 9112 / NBRC 15066 / NRRL 15764) TaxID=1179773 RepID=K0K4Q9_SACES|nr:class I SAM-dependent methyltransferase [Saccharothrix espanaensis]CCH32572.1 Methyltransferase [Saccharothrix espanaensis DSM 44229]